MDFYNLSTIFTPSNRLIVLKMILQVLSGIKEKATKASLAALDKVDDLAKVAT